MDKNNFQGSFNDEQYRELKDALDVFIARTFSDRLMFRGCRILPEAALTVEENKIVENAVDKRRYEFSAGRSCARECLQNYGITGFSLLKGDYGEPVWPPGYTGSLTHNSGLAFAVAAPSVQGFVGIDFVNLSDEVSGAHLVLNDRELDSELARKLENPELLLFSLKESVIKILSPLLQCYIEFKEINIVLGQGVAEITYREKEAGINLFWLIHGHYAFTVAVKNHQGPVKTSLKEG